MVAEVMEEVVDLVQQVDEMELVLVLRVTTPIMQMPTQAVVVVALVVILVVST